MTSGRWTSSRPEKLPTSDEILRGRAPFQSREETLDGLVVAIATESDVVLARRETASMARRAGLELSEVEISALVTAVSELAMNVFVHAGTGSVVLTSFRDRDNRSGVRATAVDGGPGIADFEVAMVEGQSTSGGLGTGLPGVVRLVGELELMSARSGGVVATTAKRSIPPKELPKQLLEEKATTTGETATARWIRFGACLLPAEGSLSCGDGYFQHIEDEFATLAVVDGLGHGISAATAMRHAIAYLAHHFRLDMPRLLLELNRTLEDTVGVAFAMATIDLRRHRCAFTGVGNVRGRLLGAREFSFESVPGVLGDRHAPVEIEEREYRRGDLVLMYSDGVRLPHHLRDHLVVASDPLRTAREIMRLYRNSADDAVVLAAR